MKLCGMVTDVVRSEEAGVRNEEPNVGLTVSNVTWRVWAPYSAKEMK